MAAAALLLLASSSAARPPPTASTNCSTFVGRWSAAAPSDDGAAVALFQNIRFGSVERWRPPKPYDYCSGGGSSQIVNATRQGPICWQIGGLTRGLGDQQDEECLNLDVYRPTSSNSSRLPVVTIANPHTHTIHLMHRRTETTLAFAYLNHQTLTWVPTVPA